MGLLDFYQNPSEQGMLGLSAGLLQAGGPQRFPVSFGQALSGGLLQGSQMQAAAKRAELDAALINAHTQHFMSQSDALKQKTAMAQAIPGVLNQWSQMNSPLGQATTPTPQFPSTGPTMENAQRLQSLSGQPPDFSKLVGRVPDEMIKVLMEDWKLKNPDLDLSGPFPQNKRTGEFLTGVPARPQTNAQGYSTTQAFNPLTRMFEVGTTPGSQEAYSVQQDINQRTQARYGAPVTMQPVGGGPARTMSPLQFSDLMHGAPSSVPQGRVPGSAGGIQVPSESQSAFGKELGQRQATALLEGQKSAEDSVQIINTVREGRKILDNGVITGFGSDFLTGMGLALQRAGIDYGGEAPANTQAFVSNMANNVGKIIKQFGSGTGLSDADREYATKIAGGSVALDERAIRKIFDIQEKQARWVIRNHNAKAKGINSQVPLTVQEPSEWSMRPVR